MPVRRSLLPITYLKFDAGHFFLDVLKIATPGNLWVTSCWAFGVKTLGPNFSILQLFYLVRFL